MTLPVLPLTISPDLKATVPSVAVGWITAAVRNTRHDEALWQEIGAVAAHFRGMTMEEARKFPPIKALRDAYRALGNDPTRYRGSNEALVRRITQGKELYRVNTLVDINNLISLETLHSAGTFDFDLVQLSLDKKRHDARPVEGNDAMPRFSILIPARNEEQYLPGCLGAISTAAEPFSDQVEVIVAVNRCTDRTEEIALAHGANVVHDDSRNLAKIRNSAAKAATGDIIVTIDADSRMSRNTLVEIDRLLRTGRYIGGGVMVLPERWSLGIVVTAILLAVVMLRHRVSGGLFWCLREHFEAVGGFNESYISVEDLDFAKRLKAYGGSKGKRWKTITKAHVVTSCRKFDTFGDWFFVRNPGLVRRIFTGKSQEDADHFYYDVKR